MRVFGWFKPPCEMKVTDEKVSYRHHRPINIYMSRFESEHNCCGRLLLVPGLALGIVQRKVRAPREYGAG